MEKTTIWFENGDRYKGEVDEQGLPHGTGHMDYKLNGYYGEYDGRWEHGKRCGQGRYQQSSRGGGASHRYSYYGEWLDDMEHGSGTSKKSDEVGVHRSLVTEVYKGTFSEGKRHGHGVVVRDSFDGSFANGKDRFEGDFENGDTIGQGVWEYANGDRFEGHFKGYFMKHGHGIYTFKDGKKYEGDWDNGSFLPESYLPDPSIGSPTLVITEEHSGFDYSHKGCFLLIACKGVMRYEESATLWRDYNFHMDEADINIMDVASDSVTFEVKGDFTADGKPLVDTIKRGEQREYKYKRMCTATLYGDEYDYSIVHLLKIGCY